MTYRQSTVLDTLLSARVWLADEAHWMKGNYGGVRYGRSCLAGAIDDIGQTVGVCMGARLILRDVIEATHGRRDITGLNDGPDTTHADILNVLDAAIDVAIEEAEAA